MRMRRIIALAWVSGALGCPSTPPRFGGGAADGVAESLDDGPDGDGGVDGMDDGGSGTEEESGGGGQTDEGTTDPTGMDDAPPGECLGGTELGSDCDPFADACPECSKCVPYSASGGVWSTNVCAPVQPEAAGPGEPCNILDENWLSGVDTCAEGLHCWDFDFDTGIGRCRAPCEGSFDDGSCANPNEACLLYGTLAVCVDRCHPLQQASCGVGNGCYPLNADEFGCIYDGSYGAVRVGDPCTYANECEAGSMCVGAQAVPECTSMACCTPFCDVTDPTAVCPPGQDCVEFFAMAPTGYEDVGLCAAP